MIIKTLSIPALTGALKTRLKTLYTMIVKNFHGAKVVVNNNEEMSCSRLRSFIGH